MNYLKIKYVIPILFINAIFVSCEDPVSSPQKIPIETLLSAPDTVNVDGAEIILTSYLWRDFMPISPPDGKPLITVVNIETIDSTDLPESIEPIAVYVVYGNQVWSSFFADEEPPGNLPFRLIKIARDGPKWDPGIYVDVIVLFSVGRERKLLRVSDQIINRTD